MTRARRWLISALICAAAAACAGRLPPVPDVPSPRYPDFVFPGVPPALAGDATATSRHERGWRFLQAGDLRNADREFSAAVKRNTGFFPADAGLGYVSLAQRDYKSALTRFDLALRRSATYAPALVGRGDALLALSRTAEALRDYQAALAADPSLTIAAQRVQVLQLRALQADLTEARRAADAGRLDEARRAYQRAIAASPESAFLYRDLGSVERRRGDNTAALNAFRRAVAIDPADTRSLVQAGEILEAQGDFDGAVQAYAQAAAIEPGEAIAGQLDRARQRAALAKMPAEFADIAGAPRLTRGDLAALIGVHFPKLLDVQQARPTPVITDARGHWASPWILSVTRAGLMEVNANHTFQPRSLVRRLDLARVMSRLLDLAAASRPGLAARWQASAGAPARPPIVDVPPSHLNYAAVAHVVAAGVMPLFDDGTFRPAQVVTGQEALQVMDRVQTLLGRALGLHSGGRLP
jgi:tetratricopeptide (TPR) repeat protein